jgi:PKD repeat protein
VNYTQSGTYSIINRAENKCGVSADTIQFTIRPPAPIAITPISLVCNTDTTIQLQVNPVGGIWSGASITQAGLFNPRTAPLGINTLRYDYGAGQCFNTNTTNVDVSGVVIQTGSDTFVCQNAPPIFLRGQTPAHGIWSGLGIVDSINGLFNPRLVSVGMHEVTYTIKNGQNRCVNQKNRRVLVYPAPTAAFDSLPIQCVGVPVQFKNRSIGIDSALWTFGDGQTTPLLTPSHPYTAQGLYPVTLYVRTLNSCVDSFHRIVDVSQPGISAFIPDKHTGCGPLLPVYFTNTSTGRNLTYAWDFGTGRHDSTRNVLDAILFEQRNYDTIYNVRLTTTNSCGVSTVTDTIHLKPRPTARFGIRPHNDCSPMTVEFSNASPGYPTQFYWYFGNGSSSQDSATQVQIFRTDTTERTFKITLVVSNVCGSDTIQQNLTVLPPRVKAFFTIDTLSGCAPFTPRCESFSTVGSTIWWDSGDAGINKDTTGGQRFSHTYNREGFYTITLFAANPNGCGYDSLRRTIQVLPPAQITIGHDTISCKGDTLNLRAVSSNFFFRVWYFGDGDSSRIFNARHIYQAPGTYPITMYGNTLNGNCPVKRTSLVTIRELPKADLVVDRIDGCPPLTVNFGNRSTQAGGVGIPPYSAWDFGDKNTTNISSPTHVFDTSGNFSIRLRVTDNFGCSDDTIWSQVIVHPVPDARFTIQPTKACGLPMLVRFQNQTLGAVAYNWQLGNGLTSTATHPTTSYGTEGVVPVRLIATNSFFCKDTFYESVHPTRQPTADFTLSPQSGCEPLQVHFQDRSTNATGRRFWRFGDGSTDTLLNPNHVYVNHGIYTPKLIVSNGTCYDSLQLNNTVTVLQTPIADFEPRDSLLPRPTGVILFNNQSKFAQSYVWDFGDGSGQVSQTNPTHRYNQARLHQVTLFATAANGCKDTIQKPVNPQFFSGLYVPNVFSPASGSEGIRHFLPKGSMLKTYYAAVYSAYGDLIWESDKLIQGSPVEGWDGTRNGTPLPQDVYVWKIQATFEDGTIWVGMTDVNGKHSTVGTLTLLR